MQDSQPRKDGFFPSHFLPKRTDPLLLQTESKLAIKHFITTLLNQNIFKDERKREQLIYSSTLTFWRNLRLKQFDDFRKVKVQADAGAYKSRVFLFCFFVLSSIPLQ